MKKIGIVLFLVLSVLFAGAQKPDKQANPDEQSIVHKEYDENGKLIHFDSTYVHSWSNVDSTFNPDFAAPNGFNFDEFFHDFLSDSSLNGFNFPHHFDFSPFNDDEFFNQFKHSFNDSLFFKHFAPDSSGNISSFRFPDLQEFEKKLQEHFNNINQPNQNFPQNLNKQQQKELEELQKKHQKELDELMRKWKKNE